MQKKQAVVEKAQSLFVFTSTVGFDSRLLYKGRACSVGFRWICCALDLHQFYSLLERGRNILCYGFKTLLGANQDDSAF